MPTLSSEVPLTARSRSFHHLLPRPCSNKSLLVSPANSILGCSRAELRASKRSIRPEKNHQQPFQRLVQSYLLTDKQCPCLPMKTTLFPTKDCAFAACKMTFAEEKSRPLMQGGTPPNCVTVSCRWCLGPFTTVRHPCKHPATPLSPAHYSTNSVTFPTKLKYFSDSILD